MTDLRSLLGIPLLVAAIVVAIVSYDGFRPYLSGLWSGTLITVLITVLSALLAVVAATLAGLAKLYAPWPLRWLAVVYIEIFRGTSALVQLFWLFFVLPHFGVTLEPLTVAVLALGLNIGAYGAEVVRGAVLSVAKGQWEAATALNMGRATTLRRIILPQAVVAMIPPWGNLFIELLKSTALVSLITIGDVAFRAQQMNQTTLETINIFGLALGIYLCIALLITYGMRRLEHVAARGIARMRAR